MKRVDIQTEDMQRDEFDFLYNHYYREFKKLIDKFIKIDYSQLDIESKIKFNKLERYFLKMFTLPPEPIHKDNKRITTKEGYNIQNSPESIGKDQIKQSFLTYYKDKPPSND